MYFELNAQHTDPGRIKRERNKARELKKTHWWSQKIAAGVCHYCEAQVGREALTMDHVVPLARGGSSTKGNLVPACRACNENKKLETPVEALLTSLRSDS